MSLILSDSVRVPHSIPQMGKVVEVKSMAPLGSTDYRGKGEAEIRIGDCYLSFPDFCDMIMYVMTNTDLEEGDPRLSLMDRIANLREAAGHNAGRTRLVPI